MPSIDHRFNTHAVLTEEGHVLLLLLREELNALRQQAGLPLHTLPQWRVLVERAYVRVRRGQEEGA